MSSLLYKKTIARVYSRSLLSKALGLPGAHRFYSSKSKIRPTNGKKLCFDEYSTGQNFYKFLINILADAIVFQTPIGNLIAVEHLHYPQLSEFEQKYDLFMPTVNVSRSVTSRSNTGSNAR